jgi:hypothetical protein
MNYKDFDAMALRIWSELDHLGHTPARIAEYARRLRAEWMKEREPVSERAANRSYWREAIKYAGIPIDGFSDVFTVSDGQLYKLCAELGRLIVNPNEALPEISPVAPTAESVVVPREPTAEMIAAFDKSWTEITMPARKGPQRICDGYRAMLSAAPAAHGKKS